MTKEDLAKEISELQQQHEKDKYALHKKYAFANNPYKVGDIVTDHYKTVKIERIGIYVGLGETCCKYTGQVLRKDGQPAKDQKDNTVFQMNIPELNKTPSNE